MQIEARKFVAATMFLTALSMPQSVVHGQEPSSSPTTPSTAEANSFSRETMTGDWGGARLRLKEKGVDVDLKLTQFYQGIASGGLERDSEYNGKFQAGAKFDLGKLAGWQFWQAEIATEMRFGGPALSTVGTITPVNTAAIIPAAAGTVFAITSLNFTRLFPIDLSKGELFAVSAGRFNLVALGDEHFFGGDGTNRFFNMAQIGPLTVLRQVPLITNAVSFAYVRGGEPFVTLAVMDPNDHSTDPGMGDLFSDGVTFAPGINFPTKFFGLSGKQSLGGAITTKKYTPFDKIRQVTVPGPPTNPIEPKSGSWSVSYTLRQYIVERGPRDGWGFFAQVAVADKATSPITRVVNVGFGGNGLFNSRLQDQFGIAYAYTNFSSLLKDNLDAIAIGHPRPEHEFELFYNFHITPWLRLTGDLQVIRPTRRVADTAIIPAARLEILF